jgi:hypothetical protein
VADRAVPQWTEYYSCYTQNSNENKCAQNGIHTDKLNVELILESQMTQETVVINTSDGAKKK